MADKKVGVALIWTHRTHSRNFRGFRLTSPVAALPLSMDMQTATPVNCSIVKMLSGRRWASQPSFKMAIRLGWRLAL
jgi:hypothetical protein